ncbi:MAG: GNAT family N-acetyltransferase, partial [Prevotellaceae bacterium]|nr:GNAT family N-acetyltransferase [Candidatus Colivivens equi]
MNFSIDIVTPIELDCIRCDWETLEKGKDMTYFQTFSWYKMLSRFVSDCLLTKTEVLVVRDDNNVAKIIAPLWIVKHSIWRNIRKGIYIWGIGGWSDYLNLIYLDFDSHAFNALNDCIETRYHLNDFYLNLIPQETELYSYLYCYKDSEVSSVENCVELLLPESIDDYCKKLSKNARQNIRTAYNRIAKDEISFVYIFDDHAADKSKCVSLREIRVKQKNRIASIKHMIKVKLLSLFEYEFPKYLPIVDDCNSHIMSVYESDKIVAFFNYGIDAIHNRIVVMAAGIDNSYARYSPGVLLLEKFIREQYKNESRYNIDFTRGEEPYKYTLGGVKHVSYSFVY